MPKITIPQDTKILAALGTIALRHGQLDNAMRMVIKDLAGVSREEALDATAYQGFRELKDRIKKISKRRIGEGEALIKLQALLERASRATDKRNAILHSVWGFDGVDVVMRNDDHQYENAPSLDELRKIADDLQEIKSELVNARKDGFIADAIEKSSRAKPQE